MSVLQLGRHISILPIVHGSGDFAFEVRRRMLSNDYDCLAVPLPPSFQRDVEAALDYLPTPTLVVQPESRTFATEWTGETDEDDHDSDGDDSDQATYSYVPLDPCQPVIAALRVAREERLERAFIDLETSQFEPYGAVLPDAYALKKVALERFAAAMLPVIERPESDQRKARIAHMARRLKELEFSHRSILFVCSVLDWPWIREAYQLQTAELAEHDEVEETEIYQADNQTLLFMLGELPFITSLYERARSELGDDANLSIDGVKELLVVARESYKADLKTRARKITPHLLRICLKYLRNLALLERRFTPDLYSMVIASKQTAGDQYAMHVAETARAYPYSSETPFESMKLGIDQGRLPDGEIVNLVSRLPGPPVVWRSLELKRKPAKLEREAWQMRWNPYSQCSWPPEDQSIENFRSHVFQKAKAIMGTDLARTEKFTTSIQDGIDIRDTLRHWYEGDIYVKVLPPSRGRLDCAVMLFESPADPRDYPYRTTWFSEFEWESTLSFFATDFRKEPVGPGICLATYGGALFLFPPQQFPDIWTDPQFDFTETLEERLLAAACTYSDCKQIALLAPLPPGAGWRKLARKYGKQLVHVPMGQFSEQTLQQLRMFHVLNGKQVRSFAADFIRKA